MTKQTKGKPKLRLIPYSALVEVSKVREFGIAKYNGDDNGWKTVDPIDFLDAALRHIYKSIHQEEHDDESGLDHISHAACSLLLALAVKQQNDNKEKTNDH